MNKISSWLWFDTEAEEAARFYASVFRNTQLGEVVRTPAGGGKEVQCGWVIDRYGFRWQIVPEVLYRLTNGPGREVAKRATEAMMKMVKLDVAELERAARG